MDVQKKPHSCPAVTARNARKTENGEEQRSWYLSLRRSFDNLKALRSKIENELIPAMILEASQLADRNMSQLADHALAGEIVKRNEIYKKWIDVYWNDFIPFAHGMRLFGQIYNDVVRPADPHEFMVPFADRQDGQP